MSTYYISCIWEQNSSTISHALVHSTDSNGKYYSGKRYTRTEVVNLIKQNNEVWTLRWDYDDAGWRFGAKVMVVNIMGDEYIRTVRDTTKADNLDNILKYDTMIW